MDGLGYEGLLPSTSRTPDELFDAFRDGKISINDAIRFSGVEPADLPDDLFYRYVAERTPMNDNFDVISPDTNEFLGYDPLAPYVKPEPGPAPEPWAQGPADIPLGLRGTPGYEYPPSAPGEVSFDEILYGPQGRRGYREGRQFSSELPEGYGGPVGAAEAAPMTSGWSFDPEVDMPPAAPAGSGGEGSSNVKTPETELDIELNQPNEDVDRITTELQRNDRDAGGDAVRSDGKKASEKDGEKDGEKKGGGLRGAIFGLLGLEDTPETRHAFTRAGGEILSNPAGNLAGSLGRGINAGLADYDQQNEASLREEAERQRMSLAQEEMERRRRKDTREEANDAMKRSLDILDAQRDGVVFKDGMPVGWSSEQAIKYGGGGDNYKWQSSEGKRSADVAAYASQLYRDGGGEISYAEALDIARRELEGYSGWGKNDPLAGLGVD